MMVDPTAGGPNIYMQTSAMASSSSATSARAMKAGVTLTNQTKLLDVGGRVSHINLNQRIAVPALAGSMTSAEWLTLIDELTAHPDCQETSGHEFLKPNTFVCHPANTVDYLDYRHWRSVLTPNEFGNVIFGVNSNGSPRPMSTSVVIIHPTSATQTYTVSFRSAWYQRHAVGSIAARSHAKVPTTPIDWLNRAKEAAESAKNVARIGEFVGQMAGKAKDELGSLGEQLSKGLELARLLT
jgi:hypothetical protein